MTLSLLYVQTYLKRKKKHKKLRNLTCLKKVSEYDQKIPQSQIADNLTAPGGRATQPSRDTKNTNLAKQPALSSPSR